MKKISLILFIILLILSCGPTPKQVEIDTLEYLKHSLPQNAIITKYLGNDWCYYELDGKTFLYHKSRPRNYSSYEALTQVQ